MLPHATMPMVSTLPQDHGPPPYFLTALASSIRFNLDNKRPPTPLTSSKTKAPSMHCHCGVGAVTTWPAFQSRGSAVRRRGPGVAWINCQAWFAQPSACRIRIADVVRISFLVNSFPYSSRHYSKPGIGLNNESSSRIIEKRFRGMSATAHSPWSLTLSFPRLPFYAEQLLG